MNQVNRLYHNMHRMHIITMKPAIASFRHIKNDGAHVRTSLAPCGA